MSTGLSKLVGPVNNSFNPKELNALLDCDYPEQRQAIKDLLKEDVFRHHYGEGMVNHRERTLQRVKRLAESNVCKPDEFVSTPLIGSAIFDVLHYYDLSVAIKWGVQIALWGGSIQCLGTEKHMSMQNDIINFKLPGGLALTELGHGSDARNIETIASYDDLRDEIDIHTPNETAQKYWIGNAANDGIMMAVFAQLIVKGQNQGVHSFIVPIRDRETKKILPGVTIEDCGHKGGLNGVDNGRIWFDHVKIPRKYMLDKHGTILDSGEYSSPVKDPTLRFVGMLGALVRGRFSLANGANNVSKLCLTITLKYAMGRRQFGPKGKEDIPLIRYQTHQRRLFPLLAKTYAINFTFNTLKKVIRSNADPHTIHIFASALKSYASWHAIQVSQTCRECCGGNGLASENIIARMKADVDIYSTFEGDNTVLMQQVVGDLLKKWSWTNYRNIIKVPRSAYRNNFEFSFKIRKVKLLYRLYTKLLWNSRNSNYSSRFFVWNSCLDLVMRVGKSHIEEIVLHQFGKAIRKCKDPQIRKVLNLLYELYARSCLEESAGWEYEDTCINDLNVKILPFIPSLLDSFGIPDHLLDVAPITHNWKNYVKGKSKIKARL